MTIIKLFAAGALAAALAFQASAQTQGISPEMLQEMKTAYQNDASTRALENAISNNDIKKLAVNQENRATNDTYFSNKVKTKGLTDQKQSGRCWLFTGLNVMRPKVIEKYHLDDFNFSQNYSFFYDQLEKANLFLEGIIETAALPMDDRKVEWLFKHPISDGGVWNSFANVAKKYGAVPQEIMPETYHSNHTATISRLIRRKLREDGMQLRQLQADGKKAKALQKAKTEMLSEVYRMLALTMGEPVQEFTWRYKDQEGQLSEAKTYTPKSFYEEAVGVDVEDYVMLMNDPSREYYRLYEIELDRNVMEGMNWRFINLPNDEIKNFAKESIIDNEAMYISCDVGKKLNRDAGFLDVQQYDYGTLLGVEFGMDKTQRVQTFESGSSHAMTLMAVDLNKEGTPMKWMVENSWGNSGHNGHLIITDEWFNEFMFRVVVNKKFISPSVLKVLDDEPIMLPPWDPMFAPEQ